MRDVFHVYDILCSNPLLSSNTKAILRVDGSMIKQKEHDTYGFHFPNIMHQAVHGEVNMKNRKQGYL
jgi:hypothetical protein